MNLTSCSKISNISMTDNSYSFKLEQTFSETLIEITARVELDPFSMNRLIGAKYNDFMKSRHTIESIKGISIISDNTLQITYKINGTFKQSMTGIKLPLDLKLRDIRIERSNDYSCIFIFSSVDGTIYKYFISDQTMCDVTTILDLPSINALKSNLTTHYFIDCENSLSATFDLPVKSVNIYSADIPLYIIN